MQKDYTAEAHFRQRMMKYGVTQGTTKAAIRYRVSRKTYYKWLSRWDGRWKSLMNQSRRLKHSPRKHSEETLRKIGKRLKQCRRTDILMAYQLSVERDGYTGSYGGFKRICGRIKSEKKGKAREKRENKPYEQALYPGQKVQMGIEGVRNGRAEILPVYSD